MLTQIADGVWVHQSELLANNTVVVEGDDGVLVVDAGITGDEMRCLASDIGDLGLTVVAGFSTHPDWDHVLWHAELGDVPRYATARGAAFMHELRARDDWQREVVEGLPPEIADETPLAGFGILTALADEASQLPWEGPHVRVIEHPAHALGHAALLIEDRGVLVAGDMLSDVFVPMLGDSDDPLGEYLVGLGLLEDAAGEVDVVIPGHGSAGWGDEVRARIARDRAYVHALRDGRDPADPRITSPRPGWEWVADIHEGQVQTLAERGTDDKA